MGRKCRRQFVGPLNDNASPLRVSKVGPGERTAVAPQGGSREGRDAICPRPAAWGRENRELWKAEWPGPGGHPRVWRSGEGAEDRQTWRANPGSGRATDADIAGPVMPSNRWPGEKCAAGHWEMDARAARRGAHGAPPAKDWVPRVTASPRYLTRQISGKSDAGVSPSAV